MNTAAIASHLNIVESAIKRCEEWANVLFVVVKGLGARFVSKRIVRMAETVNLPKLEGSDKQVAWAESIRNDFLVYTEDVKKMLEEEEVELGLKNVWQRHAEMLKEPIASIWIGLGRTDWMKDVMANEPWLGLDDFEGVIQSWESACVAHRDRYTVNP